jgi:antitoxin MazE
MLGILPARQTAILFSEFELPIWETIAMESSDSKIILRAMADIRRRQIVSTKANPATEDLYDNSFVHAILHSIYPIRHEHPELKEDVMEILDSFPFYETYDAGFELVESIAKLMDEKWLKKEKITFYDIEGPYKLGGEHWPGTDVRVNLINICRYFYLCHMFDAEFWKEFMSDAPSEASDVTSEWSRQELVDWA